MERPFTEQESVKELPYPLKVFLLLSVGLTLLSFVYTIACRHMNMGLPYSFPYFYLPENMFSDLTCFFDRFHYWGTPVFFGHEQFGYFMYPAPLVHVFRFFLSLPHRQTCYLVTLFTVAAFLALAFIRVLRKQGMATMQNVVFV